MKGHDVQPAVFIKLRGIGDDFLGQPFFHTGSDTTKSQEFGKFESTFDDTVQRMIHGDSIIPNKSSRVSKFGGHYLPRTDLKILTNPMEGLGTGIMLLDAFGKCS